MSRQPTAILLDVGGVFLLPSRDHIRSALRQVGHAIDQDQAIDRAHYVAARVFPMDLEDTANLGPYWTEYLKLYARTVGVPEDTNDQAVEHLRNEYVTGALWSQVIEGSRDGLAELVAGGVPVGIVSNSDGTIERRLDEMGICQVGPGGGVEVRCFVDSGAVGVEKPDPRIFDFALDALDLEPDGVWYVGDTPGFDVVGARRAGLEPLLMDPYDVSGDLDVTRVASLRQVAEMAASSRSAL
ncbi:MAG: HAD family hydrolase [Acidimicrobiia bacterium]